MKHRGEILQKRFEQSELKFITVRQKLGVSHNTIKNWFLMPNLEWEKVIAFGKAIGHDFRVDFPEMPDIIYSGVVEEPEETYESLPKTLDDCLKQRENWMHKYYALLEKHVAMLESKVPKRYTTSR